MHKQIGANSLFFDRDTLVNFEPGEYMRKVVFKSITLLLGVLGFFRPNRLCHGLKNHLYQLVLCAIVFCLSFL